MQQHTKGQVFRQNFSSGLVVFLIALPLCLGIALASGAPPLAGILSGVIGGILIGTLSSSPISVAGPAAGLTAIVLSAITELGSFDLFLCAGVIAGAIQLSLGFMRAGSITNYIPIAVIEGMLAGIGIIIIIKQIPSIFGYENFPTLNSLPTLSIHLGSLIIATISFIILIGWQYCPRLNQIKSLPTALIAVIAGIIINQLFIQLYSPLAVPSSQLVQLPDIHNISDIQQLIRFPQFSGFTLPIVWITGITIALVASIETLLSIEAADRLDKHRRITDTNQELRAQGIGNIVASFIGGLPITSVIIRSSANANAGANHKISTIIHGILLLLCVLSVPHLLNKIPLASLAAVLIIVGYKLTAPSTYLHFWRKGIYQFIPFIATMIAVVCLDLLKGVGIGLIISLLFILHSNMKRTYYLSREELANAGTIILELGEEVSFLNKAALKKTLKNIPSDAHIIINAEKAIYIASDILELLEDFTNVYAQEHNIRVSLKGFKYDYEYQDGNEHRHIRVEHHRQM
ncbi:hypothetical protein A6B43_00600 [Vespertiliibacter pulmonis]|uniref:MFS superfamily sulfate permease-like transporter n=1 Tax=Vespertiliibacter pulmonis TaxID=1443036 RepID=A0A3N4W4L8_9PAST|nr:SulP family inorganic anion transporter [Vespertiliibacter pulmonis]QLB20139.1 hypothetical protein A6B43_00600 [Vespertiliibacter pulmonis]RPE86111.1 MFS superfamily sulfate permease-like transporter [Vespertiliibacter pulmonis]